jgi:hypothetical protein
MHFPACDGTTKRASRIKQREIWLQHRSDKTGDSNDAYYAAAWHIPLKVLQDYALSRQETPTAHFPWCMSKEYGDYYNCHESLKLKNDGSTKTTNDVSYFVAPIMTTTTFEQEVLNQFTTPAKTQGQGSVSTRGSTTGGHSKSLDTSPASPVSSLTASVLPDDPIRDLLDKVLGQILSATTTSRLQSAEADALVQLVQKLGGLAYQERKACEDVEKRLEIQRQINETQEAEAADLKGRINYGLNGLLLTSAEWHEKNPQACKKYFLFPTFDELKAYLGAFWPAYFGDEVPEAKRFATSLPGKKLTHFEKCLMTMMRLHGGGERLFDLKTIWNRSEKSISKAIKLWAPKFGRIGNMLSILDVPEEYHVASCPQPFKDANMEKIGGLVDGKVIMTAENRQNSPLKRAAWSDKVHHGGMIVLQFCTPCGLIFHHGPVTYGRASETMLIKHEGENSSPLRLAHKCRNGVVVEHEWPRRLGKIPKGWLMLVDRGFAKHSMFYPNKNLHLFPSFAGKRKQFTKIERGKDKTLCKLRWVNEANFARMLYVRSLQDIVPWGFIPLIPAAVSWGFAMSNLQQPFYTTAPPVAPQGMDDGSPEDDREDDEGQDSMQVDSGDSDEDSSDDDNHDQGDKRAHSSISLGNSPVRSPARNRRRSQGFFFGGN